MLGFQGCWQYLAAILLATLIACDAQTTACDPFLLVSANSSGEIVSHSGAGVTNYSNNLACIWRITSTVGSRLVAWFTYIDLEFPNDRVEFYDSSSINASRTINIISAVASLRYLSPRLMSTANVMTVSFKSDKKISGLGFKLRYDLINATSSRSCGPISYSDVSKMSGTLTSHFMNSSKLYPPDMSCSWTLPKDNGKTIRLTVANLSLGDGDCVKLPVSSLLAEIFNLENTFCGPLTLQSPLSLDSDEAANIVFYSNKVNESDGFIIRFEYVILYESNGMQYISQSGIDYYDVSHSNVEAAPYLDNIRKYTLYSAPSNTRIEVWFTYLNLQYPYDAISLYNIIDGTQSLLVNVDANVSARYDSSQRFLSSSNLLRTAFRTDGSGGGRGYRIWFKVIQSYCYGFQSLSAQYAGAIVSHVGVGSTPYLSKIQCSWLIYAPNGYSISLWFTYFNLETCCDNVVLYNGTLTGQVIYDTLGRTDLSNLTSWIFESTSNVSISFTTDNSVTGLGFRLQYNSTKIYCSGTVSLTAGSGEIVSHAGVGTTPYLSYMQCSWMITAPSGYVVIVWFTYFDLETCCDTIALYDGSLSSGTTLFYTPGRLVDLSNLTSLRFESNFGNTLSVHFATDGFINRLGFRLRYEARIKQPSPANSTTLALAIAIPLAIVVIIIIIVVMVCRRRNSAGQTEALDLNHIVQRVTDITKNVIRT